MDKKEVDCNCCYDIKPLNKPIGNAPIREKFIDSNMYDHMESFCKFRQLKENQNRQRELKQNKFLRNPKFTDASNVEPLKFTKSTLGSPEFYYSNDELRERYANSELQSTRIKSLSKISRCPINCPVEDCGQTIGITSVLSHFLRDHKQEFSIDFQEIDDKQRAVLCLDKSVFKSKKIVCLGLLAYGGQNENDRPAKQGICTQNTIFTNSHSYFIDHLPVVIFGCKASICDLFLNKKSGSDLKKIINAIDEIYVIWLCTLETTKRIFCTLTAFDKDRTLSNSSIHEVRNFKLSQNPSEFLSNSSSYLWLSEGEINNLSNNGTSLIELEIFIHVYDREK